MDRAVATIPMSRTTPKKFLIITSIAEPTAAVLAYAAMPDWHVVLVGDRKGPHRVTDPRITFLDIGQQQRSGFAYAAHCPENHYARKNLGYLHAMAQGAEYIISGDYSCLLHLDGYIQKQGLPLKTVHIADVLASGL